MLTTEGNSLSARSAKLSGAGRAAASVGTSVAGAVIRKAASTLAAARHARFEGRKGTRATPRSKSERLRSSNHRGSVAGCIRYKRSSLAHRAYNTANIIAAPARQGRPRRRRPRAPPAARFAAERQARAPRPASCLPEKGRREHPRLPGRERARSTNPSLTGRWRAGTDRRAAIRGTAHREPAAAPAVPPGGVGLVAVPSKFSKKRKKPLSGVSTKEVVWPFSASR